MNARRICNQKCPCWDLFLPKACNHSLIFHLKKHYGWWNHITGSANLMIFRMKLLIAIMKGIWLWTIFKVIQLYLSNEIVLQLLDYLKLISTIFFEHEHQFFHTLSKTTSFRFEITDNNERPCTSTVFQLTFKKSCMNSFYRYEYLGQINYLSDEAELSHLASRRMMLSWLSKSWSDYMFEELQLTQVFVSQFSKRSISIIRNTDKLITQLWDNNGSTCCLKLNMSSWKILGYSNASFTRNWDFILQLGFIVFNFDITDCIVSLVFESYKSRSVAQSVMGAELIAMWHIRCWFHPF